MICDRCNWAIPDDCTCQPGRGAARRRELEERAEKRQAAWMRVGEAAARAAAERRAQRERAA